MTTFLESHSRLVLLDGGLGTALEDDLGAEIMSQSALWSGQVIASNPDALVRVHRDFLFSGAEAISTATYQCSTPAFEKEGYGQVDARKFMRKAVALAQEAVQQHKRHGPKRAAVVLSLGPFGATLRPTQEFGGFYPPPYGPQGFTQVGENTNAFQSSLEEQRATGALATFHYERLLIFAEDQETWNNVDCIAFETIPLRREVAAVRYAMTRLLNGSVNPKPWWISCVFPQGRSPDQGHTANGPNANVVSLLDAAFDNEPLRIPNGFGINCTAMQHVPDLATRVLEHFEARFRAEDNAPWLVLYPNGPQTFDETTKRWVKCGEKSRWAQEFASLTKKLLEEKKASKLLVGGCCKADRDDIKLLGQLLSSI